MKNVNALLSEYPRRFALAWLGVCLLLAATLCAQLPHARINSSVLALLPQQTLGDIPPALHDGFMQRLDRQVVWMVSSGKTADPQVAQRWLETLRGFSFLRDVKGPMDAQQQQAWGAFYFEHRNGNLDAQTRRRLENGGENQAQWILSQVYSAFSGVSGKELRNDPLMLVRGAQMALAQNASRLRLTQGWLTAQDDRGNYWYLLHGELAGSSFDMTRTHEMVVALNAAGQALKAQFPNAQVMSRGTAFYSDYASQQAKQDVSTLGLATILGVIALIVVTFRSLRPLLLCLLSVGTGALAGCAVTLLVFGELHLMTLVMSVSVIGISADYTLYYLTERMIHGQEASPRQSMAKVGKTLLQALLTTVAAYLVMMLAPFPGIRQMALFAAIGLSASGLTVIFWHPLLCRGLPVRPAPALSLLLPALAAWRRDKRLIIGLPVCIALVSAAGIATLRVNDDIAQLQALPPDLLAQEKAIAAMTGQGSDQKWFVVYGQTPQETLERMEAFAPRLETAREQGWLARYRLIPLNSPARQQRDVALIQAAAPTITARLAQAGIPVAPINIAPMPVTLENWLASPASEGWRLMWLTLPDGTSGALIPVDGVRDSAALGDLAARQPGVAWVDRKASFDALFSLYRHVLTGLLGVALIIIAIGAVMRLGLRKGLISLVPSLLSLAAGLAALAFTGQPLNIFSLLALVLVLGIGINYTLFFSNPRGTPLTSLVAITLAMITTLLTLGMLVFSATQAISGFGTVLCCGIFVAFLLSPLAMPERRKTRKSR
ncbi:MMPL family transporter [Cronobacter dublinensis]|uniref:MMPL family transporter n=1 Tax=Cronobacter dublinensis TaxID=413497 RepID=UPI0024AE0C64|nr:MMPL family transporter [Cronobacter dublinensis]MDI6444908.1 MMPL family transporter [Cronobacter dublinensis]